MRYEIDDCCHKSIVVSIPEIVSGRTQVCQLSWLGLDALSVVGPPGFNCWMRFSVGLAVEYSFCES